MVRRQVPLLSPATDPFQPRRDSILSTSTHRPPSGATLVERSARPTNGPAADRELVFGALAPRRRPYRVGGSATAAVRNHAKRHVALTRDRSRAVFATIDLALPPPLREEVTLAVGIRQQHDSHAARLLCRQPRVFVCDNLAVRASSLVARKHTARWTLSTEALCQAVQHIGLLPGIRNAMLIKRFSTRELTDQHADIVIPSFPSDAASSRPPSLARSIREWRAPSFEEVPPRLMGRFWSLRECVHNRSRRPWPRPSSALLRAVDPVARACSLLRRGSLPNAQFTQAF